MKILMLSPQYYPLLGGYETAAKRLSRALTARGHDVLVVADKMGMKEPGWDTIEGVPVRRLSSIFKKHLHQITSLFSLTVFLLLNVRKYDVLHVHQYGNWSTVASVYGWIFSKPVLVKTTSTGSHGVKSAFKNGRFYKFVLRNISMFITTSETAKNEVEKLGVTHENIVLIPNGVDSETFKPLEKEQRKKARNSFSQFSNKRLCVYCGRMDTPKNPDGLLDAWKKVVMSHPDTRLLFIGDGFLMEQVKVKAKDLDLTDKISFLGMTSDVDRYYQIADLFLLPSKREGLSNSLLEALSCGLPVVSTRVSGSIDIVEKYNVGKLVDIDDMDSFGDAVVSLLKDDDMRTEMGENARKFAVENVSIQSVAKRTEELYEALIEKKR